MPSFQKLSTLAELTVGFVGTMTPYYEKKGIPLLRSLNVEPFSINEKDMKYVSADFCELHRKSELHTGDVVIVRTGVPGTCCVIPEELDGSNCSDLVIVHPDTNKLNPDYLAAYINFMGQKQISNNKVGAVQKHFNVHTAEDMLIYLPAFEEQLKIANYIVTLNQKININKRINDNLQQMAYDTFMHSFFRKESNGKLGDIIVENAKSPIQVGDAKAANNGDIPFFTSGDAILKWPEVLVTGRNCYLNTGGNADVKFYVGDAAYSTDTWCITASGEMSDYLYLLLLSIKPELNQKYFQGTGLKHLQKPMLKDRPIYIPATKELETFNKTVQPWFDMIASNVKESQSLVALRDWLLPMLMNGQAVIED